MEQCNFCERLMEPEKMEKSESWGIVKTFHCSKCLMFLRSEFVRFNAKKQRKWRSVKEIIKEKTKL